MTRYATITQTQRNRNADADATQNATNIKRNSSKNSEPLLSLLDLSEHKNWGLTSLLSIVVQAVNLYVSRATSNKPRPLSRQSLATHATFSLFPISSPFASCAACDASDPAAVQLLAGRVSSSCPGDVITRVIWHFP